jgi:tetraacyldisaccharide 4'-kinase
VDEEQELLKIDVLKGSTVTLMSGIADPDSFENLMVTLGINIGLVFRFPDHYAYAQKDLENIIEESRKKHIDTIVTTEKDAARLYELRVTSYELRVLFLRIELKITRDEQEFYNRLLSLYSH